MKIYIATEYSLNDDYILAKYAGLDLEKVLEKVGFDFKTSEYTLDKIEYMVSANYGEEMTAEFISDNILLEVVHVDNLRDTPVHDVSFRYPNRY